MSGWGTIYHTTTVALRTHASTLARLHEQAASGSRVVIASDDPSDAHRIMHLRDYGKDMATYQENADGVILNLEEASNALLEVSSALIDARAAAVAGATDALAPNQRSAIGKQIDGLLELCVMQANHHSLGRYIFGGADTSNAPYAVERTDGLITSVTYNGSLNNISVPVAPQLNTGGMIVGEEMFRSDSRQDPVFLGRTGAAAGTGTASVRGDVWLTMSHTSTTYLGASGVAAGTDSAAGDTILGNSHTLTINANAGVGTARLDTGTTVSFTGGETNLAVENEDGQVVYIDVTGVGTFNNTVGINTTGTLSIDDGDSTAATDFTDANLAVTHDDTGRVLYVDTTGIERTGIEPVRVPGTFDLFGTLITVRDLLTTQYDLSAEEQYGLMNDAIDSLDEVMDNVTGGSAAIGARISAVDTIRESLDSVEYYSGRERMKLQNADIVQVATDLARTQTLYEMTLTSAAKLLSLSLLDFVR